MIAMDKKSPTVLGVQKETNRVPNTLKGDESFKIIEESFYRQDGVRVLV